MIDKIIPRFFDSSTDERLLEEGAMTLAQNVTISENGDGTEGVLKNVNGTEAIASSDTISKLIEDQSLVVIGSVKDDQNNSIYFFTAQDSNSPSVSNRRGDAIYQYNAATDDYKLVIRDHRLNFRPSYFIKADVINGTFGDNTSSQTILYFTDNNNPPRKINIDRALEDGSVYENNDADIFKKTIQTIKGASNNFPVAYFETDTLRDSNHFTNTFFQFATQIIYKDGEESAISPYSRVMVGRPTYLAGLNENGFGVSRLVDNVINLKHNVEYSTIPDISKIRIIARSNNISNFFIVDEFDPYSDVIRDVDGTLTTLYSANSSSYRFYNDSLGGLISPDVVNKMYDNVPKKAEGQTISNNRLFYSNYVDGYGNTDVSAMTLDVVYSNEADGTSENIDTDNESTAIIYESSEINVTVDLNEYTTSTDNNYSFEGATASEVVARAGTNTTVRFKYTPKLSVSNANVTFDFILAEDNQYDELVDVPLTGEVVNSLELFTPYSSNPGSFTVELNHTSTNDQTLNEVVDGLIEDLNDKLYTVVYDISGQEFSSTQGDQTFSDTTRATVTFSFEDVVRGGGVTAATADDFAGFDIRPKIVNIKLFGGVTQARVVPGSSEFGGAETITYANYTSASGDHNYLSEQFAKSSTVSMEPTFKAGSTHTFGIVYYDEHNRSGFVNKIGSVYVKYPSERSASEGKGPAAIKVNFNESAAPTWAKRWQIVYSGSDTYSSIFQYTTGYAYAPIVEGSNNDLNDSAKRIYVSLKTLDLYQEEKPGVVRDYSFTKGDKLRIVKYWDTSGSGSWVYPLDNANRPIEFDVVGVQTLGSAENPLHEIGATGSHSGHDHEQYLGTFLILEAPQIVAGVDSATGPQLKYAYFDWYSVVGAANNSAEQYPDTSTGVTINNWGKRTVVDIVTPRKHTDERVFYEIGVGGLANNAGTSVVGRPGTTHQYYDYTFTSGDTYFRPVSCKSVNHDTDWKFATPETWDDHVIYLEDSSITDAVVSNSWSKGRPHIVYEKAREIRNSNSVTYSDAYDQDVETLSLSSFNAALANFANFNIKYGAARYISDYNDSLVTIQENKVSLTGVSNAVINQSGGSGELISLTTDILNTKNTNYLTGDYGLTSHPESVLIYDNQIFFADSSRSAIIRITSEGLSPISEKNISSYITKAFKDLDGGSPSYRKVISGYDPENHIYYVTLRGAVIDGSDIYSNTLGYDVRRGKWIGYYTFYPDNYSWVNNNMYSFKYVDTATSADEQIMHKHVSTAARNTFYGGAVDDSIVEVVCKYNPSSIKVFDSISLEADHAWSAQVTSPLGQNTGAGNMPAGNFVKKEGYWYSGIAGDSSSNTSKNAIHVGSASVINGNQITISGGLYRKRVPVGSTIKFIDGNSFVYSNNTNNGFVTVESVNYDTGVITASGNVLSSSAGKVMVVFTNSSLNGDRIRGPYAKIKLTLNETNASELYSVNVNFTNSALNHALGQ